MLKTSYDTQLMPYVFKKLNLLSLHKICLNYVAGGEIKRDPEIGKTAIQPEPAQTADLSISGSRLISSLCTRMFFQSQKRVAVTCSM